MEITLNREGKNPDAVLKINIKLSDIEDDLTKRLKSERQKMTLPGFRKGMVPLPIAKKYLWEHIIKETLEEKLEEKLNNYLEEIKTEYLKPVLPIKTEKEINLKTDADFSFSYNVGFVEDYTIDYDKAFNKTIQYQIEVSDKDIEKEIEFLKQTYGDTSYPEVVEDHDEVYFICELTELNDNQEILDGGVQQKTSSKLKDINTKLRHEFIGKKKDEEFIINIDDIFKNREEFSEFLRIDKLAATDVNNNFKVVIKNIIFRTDAELNEEFYSKAGGEDIKTYEEFVGKVRADLDMRHEDQSLNKLMTDVKDALMEFTPIELPNNYLQRLFELENEEEKVPEDQLEKEKKFFFDRIKWTLIVKKISSEKEIKAEENEIINEAYQYAYSVYYRHGVFNPAPEDLDKFLSEFLKNEKNIMYLNERVVTKKTLNVIISDFNFKTKKVNAESFNKLTKEEHSHE